MKLTHKPINKSIAVIIYYYYYWEQNELITFSVKLSYCDQRDVCASKSSEDGKVNEFVSLVKREYNLFEFMFVVVL